MNQKKIGKFIQEMRKEKDLTQVELAEKLGVSNRTISKWENGRGLPDYSMFQDLCRELDITINEFLSGEKIDNEDYQKKFEENFISVVEYNNRLRNQKFKRFFIFVVFLVLIFFFYKIFIAYVYYADVNEELTKNFFPYNTKIKTVQVNKNDKANTKSQTFLNVYIPDGFELITDKAKSNYVNNDCDFYAKGFINDENYDAMIYVCSRRGNISNLEYDGIVGTTFPWLDVYGLLDKYGIKNSIDLIRFYEKNRDFKQDMFTKSDDIKINYIAREYTSRVLPASDNFCYLEKDLNGYFLEHLDKKNKYYNHVVLSFDYQDNEYLYGITYKNNNEDYFNSDNTLDYISSTYMDKEETPKYIF